MAEKLFPQRQRCKKCAKGLGLKSTDAVYVVTEDAGPLVVYNKVLIDQGKRNT